MPSQHIIPQTAVKHPGSKFSASVRHERCGMCGHGTKHAVTHVGDISMPTLVCSLTGTVKIFHESCHLYKKGDVAGTRE